VDEAKICLSKLAQFHGASMVLFQNQPELVAKLSPSHYAKGLSDPFAKSLILDTTEYAAEVFADELPEISKKMKAQIPEAYSRRMQNVVDPNKSSLNAVVHGDPWLNNIMFDSANKKAVLVSKIIMFFFLTNFYYKYFTHFRLTFRTVIGAVRPLTSISFFIPA